MVKKRPSKKSKSVDDFIEGAVTLKGADVVPRKGRVSGKKGAPALNVVRSTFDFPEDLHRKLKLRAVTDERLRRDIVIEAVEEALSKKRQLK